MDMTPEEFENVVKRLHQEAQERNLTYVFPKGRIFNVEEAFDDDYSYAKINIKNGKRNIVFIGLNPARNGSPLAVYKKRAKAKEPLEKIVANGSAWNRALNHSGRLEDFNELGSIYFLDICATGTLQASDLKQVQAESYMKSIEFISKYISKYLSNSKIVLCPGGKANSKKIRKALYEKIIKENKDRIYIYGLSRGVPRHIIGSKGTDLRLIKDDQISTVSGIK
ncbi:hypothetical protein IU404_02367 [Limosilactobacillus reuteri]|uniref:CRISPR-associated endonuclease Cas2 n=1 Tax=Limosilactobacillus reuteri TaxID=1598 RepID=UPI00174C8416|nr:CRISPR-associated endonuclease Cas2 [Limosilactobacillus reuteri]UFK66900.1 hypothetical protein IU404_02367 [Limosilactobacillus reuteri]